MRKVKNIIRIVILTSLFSVASCQNGNLLEKDTTPNNILDTSLMSLEIYSMEADSVDGKRFGHCYIRNKESKKLKYYRFYGENEWVFYEKEYENKLIKKTQGSILPITYLSVNSVSKDSSKISIGDKLDFILYSVFPPNCIGNIEIGWVNNDGIYGVAGNFPMTKKAIKLPLSTKSTYETTLIAKAILRDTINNIVERDSIRMFVKVVE